MMKKTLFLIFLIPCFLLSVSNVVAADNPRVYFTNPPKQFSPDSEFTVRVLIDTPQPVNAIDIDINYSRETLELLSVNSSKSFIDFWRSLPQGSSAGSPIQLQGGSIDPFSGNGGEIILLNFKAVKEGRAKISFGKVNLYYADGKGTKAQAEASSPLNISIITIIKGIKTEPLVSTEAAIDKEPPVIETAKVASSPIDNSSLAVFHAVDSGSGLKEIQIRFRKWFSWSEWETVTNPVRLPNTAWRFQIKAVDNAGNEAVKTVFVPQPIAYIALPLIGLLIIMINFIRRRQRGD